MPCVVLTGAPGAGKTTLLAELASRGYTTVPESARAIIAERCAAGLSPRPAPREFAQEIFQRDSDKYERFANAKEWVFFDRSAVEAIGMVHEHERLSQEEKEAALARLSFHRDVFILPPWRDIYTTDAERDHTYEHAENVHRALMRWYPACGYALQVVPCVPPIQRANYILQALESGAA